MDRHKDVPAVQLLTPAELCVHLELSRPEIDRLVLAGKLPPPRRYQTRERWRSSEVREYLRRCPIL